MKIFDLEMVSELIGKRDECQGAILLIEGGHPVTVSVCGEKIQLSDGGRFEFDAAALGVIKRDLADQILKIDQELIDLGVEQETKEKS